VSAATDPLAETVGSGRVAVAEFSSEPLDPTRVLAAVTDPATGGTALFCGSVRDHAPGVRGTVTGLDYSAHPDAVAVLRAVATGVAAELSPRGALTVAVVHRTGFLAVGEPAILVAAGAAHRDLAFDACRLLVDRVKAEVPIWKREHVRGAGAHWVGLTAEQQP
jgi:molybdopterin synthase catalytic subunit